MKIKKILSYILIFIILVSMSVAIYNAIFIVEDMPLRIAIIGIVVFVFVFWIIFENLKIKKHTKIDDLYIPIRRFILITRDGEREKEWHCEGAVSFLIGKSTPTQDVDIDLSESHYNEYISNTHAVLNYFDGYWYITDLDSFNGVGIKKRGEECALRLKPQVAYKIDEGDIVYISKAKILIR